MRGEFRRLEDALHRLYFSSIDVGCSTVAFDVVVVVVVVASAASAAESAAFSPLATVGDGNV